MAEAGGAATRRVWVAGATGLVGRELLAVLEADGGVREVHAFGRRAPAATGPKQRFHTVDFAAFTAPAPAAAPDAALCALGTTIAVAGSREAFRAVDFDAVLGFARAAKAAGATRFGAVSALGAHARSSSFYTRVKGEAEEALAALGFERLVLARPSLLAGDRTALGQPVRTGEQLALAITGPFAKLIPPAWRPVPARAVESALWAAVQREGPRVERLDSASIARSGRG
jgi:uncharacterized protein YbjT (DUF2867 family)